MAILRGTPRIYPVDELVAAMNRLAASVVRVAPLHEAVGFCTAWFIAPSVVLMPGYAFYQAGEKPIDGPLRIAGALGRESSAVSSEAPEYLGEGLLGKRNPNLPAVALLRMPVAEPERVLPLCFDVPAPGDPICLIHFPMGRASVAASFGQVHSVEPDLVRHEADTEPGSGGAPILDASWRVLGVHVGTEYVGDLRVNNGLPRSVLLQALQRSRWWPEIAAHHKLANVAAAREVLQASPGESAAASGPDPILMRAAVSAGLDPKSLSPAEQEALKGLVADPAAARWTLRLPERRRIIAAAGSLAVLRPFRDAGRDRSSDPLQRVLDRIVEGPPYALSEASEDELAWWIQAARWFEPVAEKLPTPSEIFRLLERRRVRSRLQRIASEEFKGRTKELAILQRWYRAGKRPLVLTGIGGIGKSALIARFASRLPDSTMLLWLDFDRADLAPDDAASVMSVLFEQAAAQADTIERIKVDKSAWQGEASRLGSLLAARTGEAGPPLLVLDSFEAAQYAERYQELWPVLELLVQSLPALRICVTGRAPVPGLKLAGRSARAWHLAGLHDDDVRGWLRAKGVDQPPVIEQVVAIADGVPLVLRLAFQLVEAGGKVEDLPRDLPEHLIAGYLYDRILDRMQNPAFKPLASALLVLRRLTVEMITPILGGLVEFPPGEPDSWFAELSREPGLVAGMSVLTPRPEVRSATLWLLERERPERVREIDRRAAAWYAEHDSGQPEDAAELVYHCLRLGDVAGAERAWRDGCGNFLTFALDDIRDPAAHTWLQHRLGGTAEAVAPLAVWELDAAERIRAARRRRHDRAVDEILRERADRSPESPLVFHDAYQLWRAGRDEEALAFLDRQSPLPGPLGRDRTLLRALLAWRGGDGRKADALLASIQEQDAWAERPLSRLDSLAILAARIDLAVGLGLEVDLLSADPGRASRAQQLVAPIDVLSPRLKSRLLEVTPNLESSAGFASADASVGSRLLDTFEEVRRLTLPDMSPGIAEARRRLVEEWASTGVWSGALSARGVVGLDEDVRRLLELALRRWWLASRQPFLEAAFSIGQSQDAWSSPLMPSVLRTLALFAGLSGSFVGSGLASLGDVLRASPFARVSLTVRKETWPATKHLLAATADESADWDRLVRAEQEDSLVFWGGDILVCRASGLAPEVADIGAFVFYLLAPDPLTSLVRDVAGDLMLSPA